MLGNIFPAEAVAVCPRSTQYAVLTKAGHNKHDSVLCQSNHVHASVFTLAELLVHAHFQCYKHIQLQLFNNNN